jgi:hypothetical protein
MKQKLASPETISPNYSRKISEVLLEFAAELAPLDSAPKELAIAVNLAILLWNTPLLEAAVQSENLARIRQWLLEQGRMDLQTELARCLEVRQTRYSTDRRMVMDYRLTCEAQGPRLVVTSLDMNRRQQPSRK